MEENRRSFLKKAAGVGLGSVALGLTGVDKVYGQNTSKNKKSKKSSSDKIRIGFIGAGARARTHINSIYLLGNRGVITAICDIQERSINDTKAHMNKRGLPEPKVYTGSDRAFEEMLEKEEFDLIIVSSPWEWHVPMSVAAMKAGVKYVAVEVSAANTVEECWDLVNTAEETGSNLMILENVCYRRDVMAVLNMVRTNVFGEIIHCRGGYEHDLRNVKFNDGKVLYYKTGENMPMKFGKEAHSEAQWRTQHSITRNGDLYPTHGAGPVANCLDINRGNRFVSLTAMGTQSLGMHKYIVDNGGENHQYSKVKFNLGDIVTSMIKCANGQTLIITHDTCSPRPYSLGFRVQGTQGLWYNDGDTIFVEGVSQGHSWDKSKEWLDKYDHILWREHGEKARGAGHGGMDYIMMLDLFNAIESNAPAPLDVYDAAAWSAISGLSESSLSMGGTLVNFPDFTRGQWIHRKSQFAMDSNFPIPKSIV